MRASLADERRLGDAIFGGGVSTFLAAVRGVSGVDLDPDTPSIFRFGAQNRDEATPARVPNTPGKPGLRPGTVGQILPRIVLISDWLGPAHHVGNLEILHHQQVIPLDERAGLLVVKILTLVGDLAMPRPNRLPPLPAVVRPTLGSAQPLLR